MKTLDELIKANECCNHGEPDSRCEDCPYNGIGACALERQNDAFFYLKEYRWVQENCASALAEKYPDQNNPLSWDELRQMEGKPVWFEGYAGNFWCIVREMQKNSDGTEDVIFDGPHGMTGVGHNDQYGDKWQVYRKERE